jgi:hypothetical protein
MRLFTQQGGRWRCHPDALQQGGILASRAGATPLGRAEGFRRCQRQNVRNPTRCGRGGSRAPPGDFRPIGGDTCEGQSNPRPKVLRRCAAAFSGK